MKPIPHATAAAPERNPAALTDDAARPTADHEAAVRVLGLAVEGLQAMAKTLDGGFSRALDILADVKSRVIVTGMGKSGHVARKTAATLASTGTPSQFVHPAEASHGDLGMITPADAVLALSNSGETAELADLLVHVRRFSIPLIAITAGRNSSLAQAANVALFLPNVAEACPIGLAPTTSTTMMLALGDALAIALLERKGFSAEHFHQFHPKGAIGRRLQRVSDLHHHGAEVPLVSSAAKMGDAVLEMSAKRFGCVGVVDGGGVLVGIVTDGDLRRHLAPDLLDQPVDRIMTRRPMTIRPQALAAEALAVMNGSSGRPVTALFVVDDGRPVGILHIHDVLRAGVA